jgi:homoserine dehydrogenase
MNTQSTIGVAVIGCGTVGGATARLLSGESTLLTSRAGTAVALRHVIDLDLDRARQIGIDESLLSDRIEDALDDDETQIVVELIGGTTAARDIILRALEAGKDVVTANKALLAESGAELYAAARSAGRCLAFEASCAGGIPIVQSLAGGLLANRIDAMYGIVNGTCNHILTAMTTQGQTYDEALAEAQATGLAEADPTLDVGGGDSAHKLAILAALAFGAQIDFAAIPIEGIDKLDLRDITWGRELGYVVKLLAIAQRRDEGLSLRVRPVFIGTDHPLAWVSGPFNAISVYGQAVGHAMFYGRGAGGMPTASAVVADILAVATGSAGRSFQTLGIWPDRNAPARQLPLAEVRSRYYLRLHCADRPGVLGKVMAILGENDISITSVLQHEPAEATADPAVPVIITTHRSREGDIASACEAIETLDDVAGAVVRIGIVDEHEEALD